VSLLGLAVPLAGNLGVYQRSSGLAALCRAAWNRLWGRGSTHRRGMGAPSQLLQAVTENDHGSGTCRVRVLQAA